MTRRFPAPWTVERIEGGFKVLDDPGQALGYVYARDTAEAAGRSRHARVLPSEQGAAPQRELDATIDDNLSGLLKSS